MGGPPEVCRIAMASECSERPAALASFTAGRREVFGDRPLGPLGSA